MLGALPDTVKVPVNGYVRLKVLEATEVPTIQEIKVHGK